MKKTIAKTLCALMAFLLVVQPTLVAAHDFGGTSVPGSQPGLANAGGEGGGGMAGINLAGNIAGGNVYLHDGSEFFGSGDLFLQGVLPIRFVRYYNSRSIYDSPLGYGWDHAYNEKLYTYADSSVVIRWSTGFKKRFVFSGSDYVSTDGFPGALSQNPDGTFTFTGPRGRKHHFDLNGCLTAIEDNHGNTLRMTYSAEKKPLAGISAYALDTETPQTVAYDFQLLRVEEWYATGIFSGRYIELSYDPTTGRLTTLTDFDGRTVSYQHDTYGNLTRIDYPQELFKTYAYEDPYDIHNITSFGRGNGPHEPAIQYANTYDDQDRVISQTRGNGTHAFTYEIPLLRTRMTTTIRDPENTVIHQFDTLHEFDERGHLIKFTDAEGNVGEYIRDSQGNCLREVVWENTGSPASPSLSQKRVIEHRYNHDQNVVWSAITLDNGETITRAYTWEHGWIQKIRIASSADPNWAFEQENSFDYNGDYPMHVSQQRILVANTPTPVYQTRTLDYNVYGQIVTISYGNGDTETFGYTDGYLTDLNGEVFTRDVRGNLLTAADHNGHQASMTYDQLDRLTKITNALDEETLLAYTGYNLTGVEYGKYQANPGRVWTIAYDQLGRKTAVAIDKDGSQLRRETYAYDSAGNLLQIANSLGQTISYTYDNKNRRASVTDITGATVTYQYDVLGSVSAITDAALNTTQYEYDDLNRLVAVQDVAGNQTRYRYNAAGLVTSITDARGQATRFGYDLAGQCLWRQEPLGQTHQYHYDQRGRLTYLINPDNQRIDYTYNDLDKVETIRFDTGTPRTLAFTYDDGGNLLTFTDDAIAVTPVYTFTYDNLSRIDTVTHHLIGKTLDYDYAHLGYRQKLTCRSGIDELFHYDYQYDDAGLLSTIQEMPLNETIAFVHDDAGRLLTKTYSGNVTATRTYKPNGLLDQIDYRKTDDTLVASLAFGYDDLGLLTSVSDIQGSASFTYDPMYRLDSAVYAGNTGRENETYTYDATGNRLSSTQTGDWTYDGNNRLTAYGTNSFTHDARGNQVSQTSGGSTTTYAYDPLNRLTGLTTAGLSSVYTYDHRSRRIKKEVNADTTWYMYDGNRLLAEFDAAGDLTRHYLHNPRGPEPLSISQDGNIYPIITNHIGVPLHVLNGNQDPVWSAQYQAFGKALMDEDPDGNAVPFTCNLRFPGQYHDSESDLYYNIARYYDPTQGRYLQPDPFGGALHAPAGLNRYPYARNNPLYNIDPDGRLVATTAVGLTLAILAIVTIYQVGSTASSGPGLVQDAKDFLDIQGAIDEGGRSLDEVMARSRRVVLGIFNSLFTRGHSDALEYMEGLAESNDDTYVDPFSRSGLSWSQWWDLYVVHNYEWATGTGYYEYEDNLPRRIDNGLNRAADWTNRRLNEAHAWSVRTYHEYRPVVEQHLSNAWQRVRQGVNYLGARAATLWGQIRNYFSGK